MSGTPTHWLVAGTLAAGAAVWGCDKGEVTQPPEEPPVTAAEWINSVNWDQRTTVTVNMVEEPGGAQRFAPNQLTFEAGRPYVLRISNPASNASKHYFSPEGLQSFYQAIATRKIETSQAEYKAPYFDAVELMVGGTLDIYFVPVLGGTYDILCTLTGHKEAGMTAQVTITGGGGNRLDLEMAADFDQLLATDGRRSGSHAAWQGVVDTSVTVQESPSYAFVPKDLVLTKDRAYRVRLRSPATNQEKHYWTAAEFFKTVVTRKVEDSQAEIKTPYLRAVELLVGGQTTLFVVPTRPGTYESRCTIPGHVERGMIGSVVVNPG